MDGTLGIRDPVCGRNLLIGNLKKMVQDLIKILKDVNNKAFSLRSHGLFDI
jgi:hypothetical protein